MANRSSLSSHVLHHQEQPPPFPRHHHPHAASIVAVLEDRIAVQHREIKNLLLENQRLAIIHVALNQELTSSQHNLHLAADSAARAKADRDAKVREVYERFVRVEDEVSAVDAMRAELAKVKSDVGKLGQAREEMLECLKKLKGELGRARGDMERAEEVKMEIEMMRKELERGRLAVEYEKKAHSEYLEQSQDMEKNKLSLAREAEKLCVELVNAEKRARAAAAANPGQEYVETYRNSKMAYGTNPYADAFSSHQLQRGLTVDGGSGESI